MLSWRGGEVKRYKSLTRDETFVSEASLPNASAKLLLFFDMAMGWSGLRAVLVRIACNHAPGYPWLPRLPRLPHVCFFSEIVLYIEV